MCIFVDMDVIGVDVDHFAGVWFRRLFVGSIPYLVLLFLSIGQRVLSHLLDIRQFSVSLTAILLRAAKSYIVWALQLCNYPESSFFSTLSLCILKQRATSDMRRLHDQVQDSD